MALAREIILTREEGLCYFLITVADTLYQATTGTRMTFDGKKYFKQKTGKKKVHLKFDYSSIISDYLTLPLPHQNGEQWVLNLEQSKLLTKTIQAAYYYRKALDMPYDEFFDNYYHQHFKAY
ncbi:MAG TPA: hypothetical protein VEY51_05310 [Chondromyces sp.]|jgi:hypothetical protein|nr:hypothetical protein [Chondromyces sp.]